MIKQISSVFIVLAIGFIPVSLFPGDINITKVAEWGTGFYHDVYIQGHYAYCAAGGSGLDIIDISEPSVPKKVGNYDTTGIVHALYVDGNHAYIADWQERLQIIDVSDPESPVLISNYKFAADVRDVYVKGHIAFVACYDYGLHIVDVSEPSKPTPIGVYDTPGDANGVYVVGDNAYVADGYRGLQIIDVSIPSNPVSVGAHSTSQYSRKVYVMGNYAYIADDYGGLHIIDITDQSAPVLAGNVSKYKRVLDVFVNGNYAYISVYEDGLQIIDISEPSDPVVIGNVDTPGSARGVHISNNFAYVADYNFGLQLVDVSDPSSPRAAGSCDNTLSITMGVHVKGNYAYIASAGKLNILDISDPSSPGRVGMCAIPGNSGTIHVRGNYAYIAAGNNGLQIIDVSKPTAPTRVGEHFFIGQASDIYSHGNYAYLGGEDVINFEGKLLVFDVSNPSSPSQVGGIVTLYPISKFAVFGHYAYAVLAFDVLEVIDISNPSALKFVGNFDIPGSAIDIPVTGNYAYEVDGEEGLQIIDISIPTAPTLIGSCDTPGWSRDVITVDGYAYVADGDEGLQVIDVSNPYSPSLAGSYDTPGDASRVSVKENYVYVADGGKLIILYVDKSASSPRIRLNRSSLHFASDSSVAVTPAQSLFITNSSGGSLEWTVSNNQKWLNCSPPSGTNSGEIFVSVNTTGLLKGTYTGTVTVSDPDASNSPQTVEVTLKVLGTGETSVPFGVYATPVDGTTVSGSIPVTGWVLDDIGVQSVGIFRQQDSSRVYIGNAVFVEGARPDVEQTYPDYPMNYQAGWGYMMLTNFLPDSGNGTFKIQAIATDLEGNQVTLGTKTIICDNANAVKPFGAIDTPTQGGTATGNNFVNFGWVLTPSPNIIPINGSTIQVWVDGVSLGNPVYNQYREDIAELFPGYNNSSGAGGYFYLDTTLYENGVHTIQWTATDNTGNIDGIGSRYFTIQNTGGSGSQRSLVNGHWSLENKSGSWIPDDSSSDESVCFKKGYNENVSPQRIYPGASGMIDIEIKPMERIEINLGQPGLRGFHMVGDQSRLLPVGSTLDRERGIFYWQPGAGFTGLYRLLFMDTTKNRLVKINIKIVPLLSPF